MSCHWYDNAETAVFTPRDYQVELLAAAYERNTIVCLGHKSSKEFIALKLLQEYGRKCLNVQKVNLYLTSNGAPSMYTMIEHLTDFKVFQQVNFDQTIDELPVGFQVYMIHPESCLAMLNAENVSLKNVHLMILEDCHETDVHRILLSIFKEYYVNLDCDKPKVLGLAGPLHSAGCSLGELSAMLDILEDNIQCKTETASDIVTVLRYSSKPVERIIQCAPFERDELTCVLEDIICTHKAFLNNHRYDPFEIYNTVDFIDELKGIPDPKKEPLELLDALLSVLHDMGPWAASRMAINMHNRIEKQKIKTPHERHYILLCLVNTAFFKIHTICEEVFSKNKNRLMIIEKYSSPKVIRLMEILMQFKPDDFATENKKIQKLNADIEKVDFQRLSRNLENSLHSLDNLVKHQNVSRSIVENLDPLVKQTLDNLDISADPLQRTLPTKTESNLSLTRRQQMPIGRFRRKPFVRRARDNNDSVDTLCAIIFCSSSTTARVIFDLLMELGRADAKFKFLKALFLCDRVADPVLEPKEAEFEHRRQEEVLKRFRIHDCNVLVSTAVLEEGIDVPKCNLVIRWDTPSTYRSYVQCKGKARATPAYHMILVAPKFDTTVSDAYTSEQLSDPSHRFLCHLREVENDSLSDSSDGEREENPHHVIIGSAKGTVKILNPEVITTKPPTTSDIRLHEIQDEFPAIEGVNGETPTPKCNGNMSTNRKNFKTKQKSKNFSKKIKIQEKQFQPDYEVIDLNEVLAVKKANGVNLQRYNNKPKNKQKRRGNSSVSTNLPDQNRNCYLQPNGCAYFYPQLFVPQEFYSQPYNPYYIWPQFNTNPQGYVNPSNDGCYGGYFVYQEPSWNYFYDPNQQNYQESYVQYDSNFNFQQFHEEETSQQFENTFGEYLPEYTLPLTQEEIPTESEQQSLEVDAFFQGHCYQEISEYSFYQESLTQASDDHNFQTKSCNELPSPEFSENLMNLDIWRRNPEHRSIANSQTNYHMRRPFRKHSFINPLTVIPEDSPRSIESSQAPISPVNSKLFLSHNSIDSQVLEQISSLKIEEKPSEQAMEVDEQPVKTEAEKQTNIDSTGIIEILAVQRNRRGSDFSEGSCPSQEALDQLAPGEASESKHDKTGRLASLSTSGCSTSTVCSGMETSEDSCAMNSTDQIKMTNLMERTKENDMKKKKRKRCKKKEKVPQGCDETGCYARKTSSQIAHGNSYCSNVKSSTECMERETNLIVEQLANYRQIEKILLQHCANIEPSESEHHLADEFTGCIEPYKPLSDLLTAPSVDLSTSIALINKYCSKLPSDTFTKLTALWRCAISFRNDDRVYQYTIRLPINSPLKYDIVGTPMSTKILARRMAALQACIKLHQSGELDDHLQPIGKEGFRAIEPDWENFELEEQDEKIVMDNIEPRPGTTKRRQYYYKRIASEFCNCRPTASTPCYLYLLDLTLQCPIPEEQNTRGRKIYPPEDAQQGFGILTLKKIPKISAFPIFTRSGEVKVSIELSKDPIVLTEEQIVCINTFLNYTFTNVLRLQKFLMLFDPDSTENCIFIVPTIKTELGRVIDWDFLKVIEKNSNMMPEAVPESERLATEFDANRFKDAVVMPWYRNQDQPQYFYVAEICPHLTPLSCFPGENYNTFKHYYFLKYGLEIQNCNQPLLDVDHTSARLNFLTPRYVNRKGVALPTSSEETKRAKRENLEQKQILVPELCTVHPFPASLWRTAVCLPCILYRINGLLLADDIRKKVSFDIGLGQKEIPDDFEWPMLDFGWSLSEVLKKSRENKAKALEALQGDSKITEDQVGKSEIDKDEKENPVVDSKTEKSANEIVLEGEKKLQDNDFIEIGTWSNDMANDIGSKPSDEDDDEYLKYLPSNVSFCSKDISIGSPSRWNNNSSEWGSNSFTMGNRDGQSSSRRFSYYDSDDSLASNYEPSPIQYSSDEYDEEPGLMRIAFTSRNEAETIETEQEIEKHRKQLSIIQATNANESDYQKTKNLQVGYNFVDIRNQMSQALDTSNSQFQKSLYQLKTDISESGMLVKCVDPIVLPKKEEEIKTDVATQVDVNTLYKMIPYVSKEEVTARMKTENKVLTVHDIEELNMLYLESHPHERFTIEGTGDVFDNFNDKNNLDILSERKIFWKRIELNYEEPQQAATDEKNDNKSMQIDIEAEPESTETVKFVNSTKTATFSFDYQPNLDGHPGPSPSIILQALTMSNANDGINLERLETIGDSFLKYAITTYLYITYENVHEGKLSHLRSKQVANLNLYRLGRRKILGEYMIATKFEPHDNWLPPCYYVPKELEKALIEAKIPPHHWKLVDLPNIKALSSAEICELVRHKADQLGLMNDEFAETEQCGQGDECGDVSDFTCFIPYNLVTQHSIPDKSVADCVEALIGAYLIECGSRGALLFMAWLGIRVLPMERKPFNPKETRVVGSTRPDADNMITVYGEWTPPKSPLLRYLPNAEAELEKMLDGFGELEATLGYKFRDRSYLLQAMTHASYSPNRLTDCYQRLEFLGDAVLDYLITRHLYEDPRQHSPGALTDLRSALVNNTIFASLAVRHGFHKYFRHLSPGLNEVIDRFVRIQNENGHVISEEYYLLSEEECDDAEDVEVPKALGDVFESIAGAIFLDSNMSLDVVWQVYSNMMKPEIEQFSNSVPKSPIRELLELEPETAKFGKPEKLADGRRVRVSVEVFSKGTFRGIGRNYRIAKCTAAKCALRQLKKQGLISKKE